MALTLAAPAILLMGALVAMQYTEGQRRFATQLTAMTGALSLATDRQIGQGQSVLHDEGRIHTEVRGEQDGTDHSTSSTAATAEQA